MQVDLGFPNAYCNHIKATTVCDHHLFVLQFSWNVKSFGTCVIIVEHIHNVHSKPTCTTSSTAACSSGFTLTQKETDVDGWKPGS